MYGCFAEYYDRLMGDVDYAQRTEYLCKLFTRFDRMPSLLLDLACGTGGFSNCFAALGVSVIGVDVSAEMLSRARENSQRLGQEVLYLCQDACELDLYGTVDGAVCCLDGLNHITDYADLRRALARAALFLEKDRLFIFDVNTVYKHRRVLGDNTFVMEEEDLFCVWSNEYSPASHITDMTLDFFIRKDKNEYLRVCDAVTERAYTSAELKRALDAAGLSVLATYADMTEQAPDRNTERMVYVTKRI